VPRQPLLRKLLLLLAAAAAIGLAPRPGSAQTPNWLEACVAIQPAVPCRPENRAAIEQAIERCRTVADQPACHRRILSQQQEPASPAPPPTVFRGGRSR
jgi:hypothetical protein